MKLFLTSGIAFKEKVKLVLLFPINQLHFSFFIDVLYMRFSFLFLLVEN